MTHPCRQCGFQEDEQDVACNLCGLSCRLGSGSELGGLIEARVDGGYHSPPGHGGALNDGTQHRFSLCEFCLDWLFARFTVPVGFVDIHDVEAATWRPAASRLWDQGGGDVEAFLAEKARRDTARGSGPTT